MVEIRSRYTNEVIYTYDGDTLEGADLAGLDLRQADLTDADLTGATLVDAKLIDASLRRADLTGANLTDADLTGADLIDVNLRLPSINGATLTGATLFYHITDEYNVYIQPAHTRIGCQRHTNEYWLEATPDSVSHLSDDAYEWWSEHGEKVKELIRQAQALCKEIN